jgi:hypothetical protein
MLTSVLRNNFGSATLTAASAPAWLSTAWRMAVMAGCLLAVSLAVWVGHPDGYLATDPALGRLLRGMALIKGSFVIGALGVVMWRYGWPISTPVAAAYAIGMSVLAGSTILIWQLTAIPLAALLFHGALVTMACLGWRER